MKSILFLSVIISFNCLAQATKVIVDKDGDNITVLDQEVREMLNSTKNIKASNVYDDEESIESFKSKFEKEILTNKKIEFDEYVVVSGDSLKLISQKIYGTTKRWKELQVINEEKLKNTTIKIGMKLKFIKPVKENENERKNDSDEAK